jgi:ketosteroid isomerase-like protein
MNRWLPTAILLGLLTSARADAPVKEDPAHEELRAVKRGAEEAFNKGDIDGLLDRYVHKDVVATWQNAEVNKGHAGIKDFYTRMMVGSNREVDALQTTITVDELAHLFHDNTATALGNMDQHFKLRDGTEFDLHSRWTATLVRDDNRWKIAAFHVSTNMFDNGVMHTMLRKMYWVGGIGGAVVLLVGVVVGRVTKRTRTA